LKPGKPVAVGEIAGVPLIGLPGNPVAALATFWLLARTLLLHLQGLADAAPFRIPVLAGVPRRRKPGRREYLRVRVVGGPKGPLVVSAFERAGSAMLSSLVHSDGLLEVPEDKGDINPGDWLDFMPYHALL
jgi:molybdopterin molybdotransferase